MDTLWNIVVGVLAVIGALSVLAACALCCICAAYRQSVTMDGEQEDRP